MAAKESTDVAADNPYYTPLDLDKPYDASLLSGKTILLTGGASGLGAAFARHWAANGAHMIIGDIDSAAGEELVAELRENSKSPHHYFQWCDVTNWQSQVALFQLAARVSPTGGIDAVVPNAGIAEDGGAQGKGFDFPTGLDEENPPEPRLKIVDVNLTGVLYSVHLAMFWLGKNEMKKEDWKTDMEGDERPSPKDRHILLIGSIGGLVPLVGSTQYTATKHAITGLFRTLRGSIWMRGIRINLLCPCFIDTPLLSNGVMLLLAGGGLGSVEDVVDAATRLVACKEVVGRALVVGPRMTVKEEADGQVTLVPKVVPDKEAGQGVWECYTGDYWAVEAFVYRYTRMLVGFAKARGWIGWFGDVLYALFVRKQGKK